MVDWPSYIKVCQDALGYSPTRGIDDLGIKTSSPAAFIQTLDLQNNPRYAITRQDLYAHSFASFIGEMEFEDLYMMSTLFHVKMASIAGKNIGKDTRLTIFSGTLDFWFHDITVCSNAVVSKNIREFLNITKRHLERAGYAQIFAGYQELARADGTFTLRYS